MSAEIRVFSTRYLNEHRLDSVGVIGVVEWVPREWWAVKIAEDGSFIPLYQGKDREDATAFAGEAERSRS